MPAISTLIAVTKPRYSQFLLAGLVVFFFGVSQQPAQAETSTYVIDPTFTSSFESNGELNAIASSSAEITYIGGDFTSIGGTRHKGLFKVMANNTVDDSYNALEGFSGQVSCLAVQPDGKLLVGGSMTQYQGQPCSNLVRLNLDGSIDTSFNSGSGTGITVATGTTGAIEAIVLQPNGKLLLSGYFTTYNGTPCGRLIRVNSSGSLDSSFSAPTSYYSYTAVTLQPDGKVLVSDGAAVARLMTTGAVDSTFTAASFTAGSVYTLAVQPDGSVLVAGSFRNYRTNYNNIVRLTSTGATDTSFASGSGTTGAASDNTIRATATQPDGKIVITGAFSAYQGVARSRIARLNANGTLDSTFNPGTGMAVDSYYYSDYALGLRSDGRILVLSNAISYNGTPVNGYFSLNSNGTLDSTLSFGPNHVIGLPKAMLPLPSGGYIVAGAFDSYNNIPCQPLVRLSSTGTLDTTFLNESGFTSDSGYPYPQAIILDNSGQLLAAGLISDSTAILSRMSIDGRKDTSFTAGSITGTSYFNTIYVLALQPDNKIIAGGNFDNYSSTGRNSLVRLNSNGTIDSTFNPGVGPQDLSSTPSPGVIRAMAVQPDSRILVAGQFTHLATVARPGIARLNANGSVDTSFNPGNATTTINGTPSVTAIALQPDGKILVGGCFDTFNGAAKPRLVRLNSNGTVDTGFTSPFTANSFDFFRDIQLQADGKIIICAAASTGPMRLNSDGSLDTTFVLPALGSYYTYHALQTGDGRIHLLGSCAYDDATIRQNGLVVLKPAGSSPGGGGGANDVTAPSVPRGVTAVATSYTAALISWAASTDNVGVTGYRIYRDGAQIGTATTTSYSDTGLTANTTYSYRIAAYDAANCVSDQSTAISVTTQLSSAQTTPYTFTTLAGTSALFNNPTGVAVDTAGNIYVADYENHTIRKITSAGTVTTLAGTAGVTGSVNGTGSAARFYYPMGVAVDSAGTVYVADSGNDTIRKITSAGVVTTLAGTAGTRGSADGNGTSALFNNPTGVAVDTAGNIYVADYENHTIRKITSAGTVTTLAGTAGVTGSVNGTGSAARFYYPMGVAVDSAGTVYVADSGNDTIRKITSAGVVTTLAGTAGTRGSADGNGTSALFNNPTGVAVDTAGNIYVADYENHTIRKITSAGTVTTLAGTAGVTGSVNGTGSAARFYYPMGVAVDSAGTVYVADAGNDTIRAGALTVTVTLGNLDTTYDGTPKSATATTTPSGLSVNFTYNGSTTAPTNAGSYAVVATVNTANYTGTASGTLVVGKSSQTITFTPPSSVTVGTSVTLSATASSGLPVSFSVASGNATVSGASFTANDANPIVLRVTQSGNSNYNLIVADHPISNIAKLTQTISFAALADKSFRTEAFTLNVTASSSLPVTFSIQSGPATISGNTVRIIGTSGTVTIKAQQAGNAVYAAATDVSRSFTITADYPAPAPDGFAASVTGGAGIGSQSVTVTTAADFRTYAESSSPTVITVAGAFHLGSTPVAVKSNKTIQGANTDSGLGGNLLLGAGVENVIIRGLNLSSNSTDTLTISGARNVFVTHCSFIDIADHAIKIVNGSDRITVSWCDFTYISQLLAHRSSVLIGNASEETAPLRVTLHHNLWYASVDQRMPLATYGHVHLYNNVFDTPGNTEGTVSSDQSQLLSERNVYIDVANPLLRRNVNTALPIGRILAIGNVYTNTTGTPAYAGSDDVFAPSYSYEMLPTSDVVTIVNAEAGNTCGAASTDAVTGSATINASSGAVIVGGSFNLVAVPTGVVPSGYQWRRNNINIPGATAASFNVSSAQASDGATYTVAVSLASGDVVVSSPRTITIDTPAPVPNGAQGGGGGGGAPSWGYLGVLASLYVWRFHRNRRFAAQTR